MSLPPSLKYRALSNAFNFENSLRVILMTGLANCAAVVKISFNGFTTAGKGLGAVCGFGACGLGACAAVARGLRGGIGRFGFDCIAASALLIN